MLATLIAVLIGGLVTIANQVTVDHLRLRAEVRKERRRSLAMLKMHLYYYYSAQLLVRDSLVSGNWWPKEQASISLPSPAELSLAAEILPMRSWRLYSGALRRLSACLALCETRQSGAESISVPDLQFLLGAFITIDEARRVIAPLFDMTAADVHLSRVCLPGDKIAEALDLYVSKQVALPRWHSIIVPASR